MAEYSNSQMEKEFDEVYQRNVKNVYKLCFVYLKNAADAEDAVQSVFLKLLQSQMTFQSREHERAWLITTTKNHCKDMLKSWWKRWRIDLDTLPEIATPDEESTEKEIIAKLLKLPQKYRIVIHLYYFEDYSTKEIAELLGRNENTIRTQLRRGRDQLKIELGGEFYGQAGYGQHI